MKIAVLGGLVFPLMLWLSHSGCMCMQLCVCTHAHPHNVQVDERAPKVMEACLPRFPFTQGTGVQP